jgi:glycosyltransferase involved in cell wall biosynthesis
MTARRILLLSAMFPPNVLGGAETSAYNMAQGFLRAGWEVGVMAVAAHPDQVCADKVENGLHLWRLPGLRPYPLMDFAAAPKHLKPIWHLQDHVDPRNRGLARQVLDAFRPDIAQIHVLQGLGYNILRDLAARAIPTTFFQHDLGLACIRMSMFTRGTNCTGHCLPCRISSRYKLSLLRRIPNLTLVSPSQGNFRRMEQVIDLSGFRKRVALNPNAYPPPTVDRHQNGPFRVLYAGRLHSSKGIATIIDAIARIAARGPRIMLDIAGAGPDETALRQKAAALDFVQFHGHVTQQTLSNLMRQSDVLVVPSIWAENSPGVLIHALSQGLPALGSNVGGIPELIEDGVNGCLLPPGDTDAWERSLADLAQNPTRLALLRAGSAATAGRFDPDALMAGVVALADEMVARADGTPGTPPPTAGA